MLWILLDDLIETVDGSEVLYRLMLLMVQKSCTTWDVKNPVKNRMNCQAQVVIAGFLVAINSKLGETIWWTP